MLKTLKLMLPMVFAMVFLANCDTTATAGTGGGTTCAITSTGGNGSIVTGTFVHSTNAKGSGIMHASGLKTPYDPASGCTQCHGSNLEGVSNYSLPAADGGPATTNPPCCTTCHGVKW